MWVAFNCTTSFGGGFVSRLPHQNISLRSFSSWGTHPSNIVEKLHLLSPTRCGCIFSQSLPRWKEPQECCLFFFFFQPSILNFPPKSSKTKLLVSSQLRISLDDKSHSVLTVGNSHLPTYSHSTPVQPNVRPARRNEPPPPWWDRQGGFPSRMCLQRLGFGGISAPKLIYFYLTSMSLVRLLHLQRWVDTFI